MAAAVAGLPTRFAPWLPASTAALCSVLTLAGCPESQVGPTGECPEEVCEAWPEEGGLLSAACNAETPCGEGLVCSPLGEGGLCSRACAGVADCPEPAQCFEGECRWSFGLVGQACSGQAPCHPGLECRDTPDGSFCTRPCDYDLPCPQGENARCVKLSQGGNACLRNCQGDADCADGLACTPLTAYPELKVCFIE